MQFLADRLQKQQTEIARLCARHNTENQEEIIYHHSSLTKIYFFQTLMHAPEVLFQNRLIGAIA